MMSPERPEYSFQKGNILALMQEFQAALPYMENAIKQDPKNADYHYFKGLVHNAMNNYFKALEEFNICLDLNPSNSEFRQSKVEALIQLGRINEAQEEQKNVGKISADSRRHPLRYEFITEVRQEHFLEGLSKKDELY